MEKSKTDSFPSMDESILNEVINFVHPNDRYLFKNGESDYKKDLSKEEFKINLINNEFGLVNDEIQSFYKRIEKLTSLNSQLDKFLTESNDQRYNQFIDMSFYQNFSHKFSETTNNILKTMRRNFNDYKNSTLHDFYKILNGYKRLNRLKSSVPFLNIYREMNRVVEYSKKLEVPVVYRILACASGIQYCLNVAKSDPRVMNTVFFNSIKDNFSRNINKFMTNIFVKNQYRYDPCDKLLILLMFGQTSEKSCEYVINFLKDELVSITSLNIQRYLNLDREFVGYKLTGLSSRDVSDQASLLPPNLSLLVVCKILSEFVSFFQTLTSRLKYESKIMQPNHFKNNNTGSIRLNMLLNSLNKTDYYLYYRNTLDLFVNKFSELVDTSYEILYKILSSFNLNGLKDQNDILKIALLILYYTTLQEGVQETTGNPEQPPKETKYKYVSLDTELTEILNDFCVKNLKVFTNEESKEETQENKKNSNTGYNRLQEVLCRILNDYTRRFTTDAMENVSISLASDTFQRLAIHPVSFDNMEIDGYCKVFREFISNGHFIYFGEFKYTTLNPFLGWTPNSNFVTINISLPLLVNYNSVTIKSEPNSSRNIKEYISMEEKNNKVYKDSQKQENQNKEPKKETQENNKNSSNNTNTRDLNSSRLVRDYGGVYTVTSREVLRSFEIYFKIIMVLDYNCVEVIQYYTKLLDEFIYKNVKGCKMEDCVIENLKKFNTVFNSEQRKTKMLSGNTICDTYRQEYFEEDRISDITRLSYSVNTVESCFTLLESILKVIKNNGQKNSKFCKYLTNYYNERAEVIVELRLMLYHIAIYNILRPKLPSMKLLSSIKSTKPLHIDTDVSKTFREFQNHLRSVREFVESADSGSFPIMVKVFLWDSIINVIKDSFKPLLNLINNNLNSELGVTISKNYSETLKLSNEIRTQYVDQVKVDYKRHKIEIANMSTYYNIVEGMLNSLKGQ